MNCFHGRYSDGHCAEMHCPNYSGRCPRHAPSGRLSEACNRPHLVVVKPPTCEDCGDTVHEDVDGEWWHADAGLNLPHRPYQSNRSLRTPPTPQDLAIAEMVADVRANL